MEKSRVGFITAFREYRSFDENVRLNKDLKQRLRVAGFGFVPIEGEWEVEGGPVQYDASFAVSHPLLGKGDFIFVLCGLAEDYDQESVMVVENAVAEFYSPENPTAPTARAEKFRTSMLDQWMGEEPNRFRGRSTMKRGPRGRSFAFSAGDFVDNFSTLSASGKMNSALIVQSMALNYREFFALRRVSVGR
jgi:hypothetical protein